MMRTISNTANAKKTGTKLQSLEKNVSLRLVVTMSATIGVGRMRKGTQLGTFSKLMQSHDIQRMPISMENEKTTINPKCHS